MSRDLLTEHAENLHDVTPDPDCPQCKTIAGLWDDAAALGPGALLAVPAMSRLAAAGRAHTGRRPA